MFIKIWLTIGLVVQLWWIVISITEFKAGHLYKEAFNNFRLAIAFIGCFVIGFIGCIINIVLWPISLAYDIHTIRVLHVFGKDEEEL